MIYFQSYSVEAADGTTEYDDGLRSTSENPKTLLSVMIQVKELPLAPSMVQIWYEQEKISELPLNLMNSPFPVTPNPYGINVLNEIEVGFDIPVGAVVKVACKAVGGVQTIRGAYRYEITT